jgi:hypothetical protein
MPCDGSPARTHHKNGVSLDIANHQREIVLGHQAVCFMEASADKPTTASAEVEAADRTGEEEQHAAEHQAQRPSPGEVDSPEATTAL